MKLIDCENAKQAMRQAFQEDVGKYGVEIPEYTFPQHPLLVRMGGLDDKKIQ